MINISLPKLLLIFTLFSAAFLTVAVTETYAIACSCNDHCNGNAPDNQCSVNKGCNANNKTGICQQCPQAGSTNGCPGGQICQNNNNGKNICVALPPTPTYTPTPTLPPPTPTLTPIINPPGPEQTIGLPSNGIQTVCQLPPLDVMLVIDTSASMRDRISEAQGAARTVARTLAEYPDARIGITTFDDNARVRMELTPVLSNLSSIYTVISNLKAENNVGTCLECAIQGKGTDDVYAAFNRNQYYQGRQQRRIVIILTDGNINRFIRDNGDILGGDDGKSRDQAAAALTRLHNDLKVEVAVAHYGDGNHWPYLQNLANTLGTGQYAWEGWYASIGMYAWTRSSLYLHTGSNSVIEWIFYLFANDFVGGYLNVNVFEDRNNDGYRCLSTDSIGNCVNPDPPLANWPVRLSRYLSNINYVNWWSMSYLNVYRTYTHNTNSNGNVRFYRMCTHEQNSYTVYVPPQPGYNYRILGTRVNPRSTMAFYPEIEILVPGMNPDGGNRDFAFLKHTPTPTPTPVVVGRFQGRVFVDTNKDGNLDTDESPYSGFINVRVSQANLPTQYSGSQYAISNLVADSYSLRLYSIPEGYNFTYPPSGTYNITLTNTNPNGVPPIVTCTVNPNANQVPCNNGYMTGLDFGIAPVDSWIQTGGIDVRNDSENFSNQIPSFAAATCGTTMLKNGNGNTPGILFTPGTNNLGTGTISSTNWKVTGTSTAFTPDTINGLSTSYEEMSNTLAKNKVTLTPLTSLAPCQNLNSCTILSEAPPSSYNMVIASQAYLANGNLTLNDVTITGKQVLIMVNGNLRITQNIRVSPGSFLMFVVSGDIIVDETVGRTSGFLCGGATSVQAQGAEIQGIYSTDEDFRIQGAACPGGNRQLNIAGTIVTNADVDAIGGNLNNNRSLCAGNIQYPSLTIQPRLDFVFSAPSYMLRPRTTWQEVAP